MSERVFDCKIAEIELDYSELFNDFFTPSNSSRQISHLVLHHIEAKNSAEAIFELKKHQVSAHFLIDENGKIFNLVLPQNIAYHAGYSYWRGEFGLNKCSVGIEFLNSNCFEKKFSQKQLFAGLKLSKHLINQYQIPLINVVGHSDIAFDPENKRLNRKQDPSHLFDWRFFAANHAAIAQMPKESSLDQFKIIFRFDDSCLEISEIKSKLNEFGYLVSNFDEKFDEEMQCLVRVFNRRFFPESYEQKFGLDAWYEGSKQALKYLGHT